MNIFEKLKNALTPVPVGAGEEGRQLLEWLGIDSDRTKSLQETTYFTCLKVLSETMGKLPLKFYQEDEKGGMVRASADKGLLALLDRPNPYMTPATFWATMEANCQHYGNAFAWIHRKRVSRYGGDEIVGLYPMRSDLVTVYVDNAGIFGKENGVYYRYTDQRSSKEHILSAKDVIHVKTWLTWDGVLGKSVQDILRETVLGAGYSQKYLSNLYKSGLTASSVLQYTGDLDEKLRNKLQTMYESILTGAKNAGKVVALPVGMTLTPLTYKLSDAQFIDLKKYSALQIAAAFGVKPNQLNDYEKSSYANSESQQLAFLVDTMLYRLAQYEQEINYKCLTEAQRLEGCKLKFNEKVLLRADAEAQMRAITSAVNNGVYTPNEGRHLLDLPSEKGGDVLIVNGNYVPLTDVGAAYRKGEQN